MSTRIRPGVLRTVIGFVLIAVGLVGLVLPLLPGIPLLILGVTMVGIDHPLLQPVRRFIARFRR
jgi:uncharacterized membrane protein YbaN (DUF454 family)